MAAVMWLVSVIVMPLLPVMPDMCLSVVEREGPTCRQKVASLCHWPFFVGPSSSLSTNWMKGSWSHSRSRCLKPGFIFVKPSAHIISVGIHLVCCGVTHCWMARILTRLLFSDKLGFIETMASYKDFASVAWSLSSLQLTKCAGWLYSSSEIIKFR